MAAGPAIRVEGVSKRYLLGLSATGMLSDRIAQKLPGRRHRSGSNHGARLRIKPATAERAASSSRRSSTPSQKGFTGCQSMSGREPVRKKVGLNTKVPGARYRSRTVPL